MDIGEDKYVIYEGEEDQFLPPYLAAQVVLMCLTGVKKDSEASNQLKQFLNLKEVKDQEILNLARESIDHIDSLLSEDLYLKKANKIYLHKNILVKPEFKETIDHYFKTEVESIDFDNGPSIINEWFNKKTDDKINCLVPCNRTFGKRRVLFQNAVYFKTKWLYQFNKNLTEENVMFKTEINWELGVEMMKITEEFKICEYVQKLNASVCQLPFASGKMFMTILLPHTEETPLNDVESKLDFDILKKAFDADSFNKVEIHLPKFKIEKSYEVIYYFNIDFIYLILFQLTDHEQSSYKNPKKLVYQ